MYPPSTHARTLPAWFSRGTPQLHSRRETPAQAAQMQKYHPQKEGQCPLSLQVRACGSQTCISLSFHCVTMLGLKSCIYNLVCVTHRNGKQNLQVRGLPFPALCYFICPVLSFLCVPASMGTRESVGSLTPCRPFTFLPVSGADAAVHAGWHHKSCGSSRFCSNPKADEQQLLGMRWGERASVPCCLPSPGGQGVPG